MKDIIKKEILNYINENRNSNALKYFNNIEKDNISYLNYELFTNDYDIDIEPNNLLVNWGFIISDDEYGINGFKININKIEGSFILKLFDKQSDELMNEIEKDINTTNWFFEVNADNYIFGTPLFVKELIFDFSSKNCVVLF